MAAPRRALPLRRSRAAHSSCRLRPRAACPSCGCSRGRRFLRCEMAPRPTRVPRRPFRPRSTSTLHFLAAAIHMGRALPSFRSASSWFWHASVSVAGLPAAAVAVAARAAPAALGARRVCEVRAGAECGCGCGRICACVSSFLRASCGLTCAELKTGARAASIGAAVGAAGSNASASAASGGAAAAGGGDAAPSAAPSFAPSTTAFPCCPLAHALRQPLGRL